jgi:hypothetical protein
MVINGVGEARGNGLGLYPKRRLFGVAMSKIVYSTTE